MDRPEVVSRIEAVVVHPMQLPRYPLRLLLLGGATIQRQDSSVQAASTQSAGPEASLLQTGPRRLDLLA
jgi:hypothetical protein